MYFNQYSDLEIIHESLINGQKRQAINQIFEYEKEYDDFWLDYIEFLEDTLSEKEAFKNLGKMIRAFHAHTYSSQKR